MIILQEHKIIYLLIGSLHDGLDLLLQLLDALVLSHPISRIEKTIE